MLTNLQIDISSPYIFEAVAKDGSSPSERRVGFNTDKAIRQNLAAIAVLTLFSTGVERMLRLATSRRGLFHRNADKREQGGRCCMADDIVAALYHIRVMAADFSGKLPSLCRQIHQLSKNNRDKIRAVVPPGIGMFALFTTE